MLGLLPFAKVFRLLPALLAGPPGLQLLDGIFQGRIVVVAVLELKLLRLQHFRAQPRPDKLFRRHTVIGDEPQHGKGGRPQNAHPGQGFHPKVGAQDKVKAHGHAAGEDRKDELPHTQPEKHGFGVVADFPVDLDFQNITSQSHRRFPGKQCCSWVYRQSPAAGRPR
ncbi:hypothetical protein EC1_06530 [Faecalitalea cylindroides T2-87]|uniref:Uncharacterized protein n=1 Tax=Faecalitalea cylindroides T2-87 TaxID=717960 RepID=D4JDJ8_9FIRM|nr:hypothetical protein EC1_06530 [Faecalitalea cylindroides T2-87]